MWESDKKFVAWLDREGLGTDEIPLGDDELGLMYRAWLAGIKSSEQNQDE